MAKSNIVAAAFPAVFRMPQLVSFAASHGYAVFFVTGRPRSQTDATITNLTNAGYPAPQAGHLFLKPSTPPSYLHCANAPTCTTIEYKSGTRAYITSQGYSSAFMPGIRVDAFSAACCHPSRRGTLGEFRLQ